MEKKLFDSERKVMEVLWNNGDLPAGKIAAILNESIGWNRNTTYTVIKKCIDKGVISRLNPKIVTALREYRLREKTEEGYRIDKQYNAPTSHGQKTALLWKAGFSVSLWHMVMKNTFKMPSIS